MKFLLRKLISNIKEPKPVVLRYLNKHASLFKSDELFIRLKYRIVTGKKLNLNTPKGFCEKLQWLKLYDRKPIYTLMVDKYLVKQFIADIIGEKYLIPTIGVWANTDDIDWNKLPSQFVLKTNHAGGSLGVVICKDKSKLNKKITIDKLNSSLELDSYSIIREWPYKNIKRLVFAEKYMEDESGELRDYKVMCFGGEPKLIQVHLGRNSKIHTQDFYDIQWNKLEDLNQVGCITSNIKTPKPLCLDQMLELSRKISRSIPQLRVDWYIVKDKLYFGECTFYDASGLDLFLPNEKELEIGSWITLPEKTI